MLGWVKSASICLSRASNAVARAEAIPASNFKAAQEDQAAQETTELLQSRGYYK